MRKLKAYRAEMSFFFKNAPLAIFTSSLPGFVNYAVILFLTAFHTMENVGQYRLFMSYFALTGLFSFQESAKIIVRAQATGEKKTIAALFFMRLYGMIAASAAILAAYGVQMWTQTRIVPDGLLEVSLLGCVTYAADLFFSILQADRKFPLLAGLTALKYLASLVVFIALMALGRSVYQASMAQLGVMAGCNAVFYVALLGRDTRRFARYVANPFVLFRRPRVREAMVLSVSNFLPSILEHVDKMLIGYVFGIETLGLYTLAFSTGRFIYNALKPAFYIYYRHFVEKLPTQKLLWWVMGAFTFFGVCLSAAFFGATHFLSAFAKFKGGEVVVAILFLSYGIAMVDAIYCQSYGINKKTQSHHLLISNSAISLLCLALIGSSAFAEAPLAMALCAAHFPLSHAGSVLFLSRLKRTSRKA